MTGAKTGGQVTKPTVRLLGRLRPELDESLITSKGNLAIPPGHYYSPIPSIGDLKVREKKVFRRVRQSVPGIDLNSTQQITLLKSLARFYTEMPWSARKNKRHRYFFRNIWFRYADATILFCMIRLLRPARIIEVGAGYSSALILDTNELFFANSITCEFIDPNPARLISLTKDGDCPSMKIIKRRIQDVDTSHFKKLQAGDILFIDSSHVSKVDSDVNHLLFEILPRLSRGVYVHFHDIFYPFEYPKAWIYGGIAWNEAYLVRAFLQYNTAFKIVLFNSLLARFHAKKARKLIPLFLKDSGGSLWLVKVR